MTTHDPDAPVGIVDECEDIIRSQTTHPLWIELVAAMNELVGTTRTTIVEANARAETALYTIEGYLLMHGIVIRATGIRSHDRDSDWYAVDLNTKRSTRRRLTRYGAALDAEGLLP